VNPFHSRVKNLLRGLALSLSLAGLLLVGCGEKQPTALLASAKDYLARKDNRAAVIQLKSALQRQPELPEARFLLGRTLLEDGDAVSGEVELRKALDLRYPQDEVLPPLVRAMVRLGKAQRAIQDFGTISLAQPAATAELKTALATAYAQEGDKIKAKAAVDDALRAAPDLVSALLIQAQLRVAGGDVDGAFASLDQAIAKDPRNVEALQLKGDFLFLVKGDAEAALQVHRQALALRPDWLPAQASILEILLSRHDLPAAKAQLDQLKKTQPNHPLTRYFGARLAFLNKDFKTARELLQPVVDTAPNNLKVLLLASATELQSGSLPQAEGYASKALQRFPDSPLARRLLAQIQIAAGDPQRAQGTLEPLLARGDVDSETLNLAAQAALQRGDAEAAESYFLRAAKTKPDDPRNRTALALIQYTKGHPDIAFARLGEISASDPGTVADMAIVSGRLQQGDFAAALKAVDSLEHKQPGKPFAIYLRGQIQMARKDPVAARESFADALSVDPLYFPAAASLASLDLADKKPDDARKHFDRLLAADPRDIRALLAVVELRAQAGASKEEVAGMLRNAIQLNPTIAAPRVMLVDLHLRRKDHRAALIESQEGNAAIPGNPEMLDALGRSQLASGDSGQAIGTFSKLVSMKPRSPQARMRLAEGYMATSNRAAARESLDGALEVSPGFLPAQRGLIVIEIADGRPEQALAIARTVQRERPDQGAGYLLTGDVEVSRKNWDAAIAAYRAGLAREPVTEFAVKLHGALGLAKRNAEADVFAAGWIKQHPQDAAFRSYLGDLAVSKHDLGRAESEYLAVLKLQPDNAIALNNLAWVSHKLGKPGAAEYAERANALGPGQPAFMDTLATVLADAGQEKRALEIEKQAIALQPESHAFRLNLAKLYIKAGDKAQARIELDQLAKLGDKFRDQAEVGELLKAL
jgi:cellulose synthase operon protein C